MKKLILLAEEGERKLIHEVGAQLGCADWLAQYDVLVTGVGAINIIRALRHLPADTEILNIGYAGSANFNLGTLVAVTEARLNHPHVSYPEPALPLETPACATSLTRERVRPPAVRRKDSLCPTESWLSRPRKSTGENGVPIHLYGVSVQWLS